MAFGMKTAFRVCMGFREFLAVLSFSPKAWHRGNDRIEQHDFRTEK